MQKLTKPPYGILEDKRLTQTVERILREKRKTVFQIPRKGSHVICHLSGGLDTFIVAGMLMKDYGLKIHPVYFNRFSKRSRATLEAARKLHKFLVQKFPSQIKSLQVLTAHIPPPEIKYELMYGDIDKIVDKKTDQRRGIPFQPAIYAYYCLHYAQYLEEKEKMKIRTIFSSHLPRNATWHAYETLTALRLIMLELCSSTKDWSWQFTSLPLERKLHKTDIIEWGIKNKFPLEITWTCGHGYMFQCGMCNACFDRVESFQRLRIKDPTTYLYQEFPTLKRRIKTLLYHYKKAWSKS